MALRCASYASESGGGARTVEEAWFRTVEQGRGFDAAGYEVELWGLWDWVSVVRKERVGSGEASGKRGEKSEK